MMWRIEPDVEPKAAQPAYAVETVTRDEAIAILREKLLTLVDDENSICKVAAEKGILCRGFQRYSDFELRKRYGWIARKDRHYTRNEIEDLANRWQLARQDVDELPLACDVQAIEHDSCRGWADYTHQELIRFVAQLAGRVIEII